MKTLRRFGRIVPMPSTLQIRNELRAMVLPEAKPALPPPAPPAAREPPPA
jgi:hypothetical protein